MKKNKMNRQLALIFGGFLLIALVFLAGASYFLNLPSDEPNGVPDNWPPGTQVQTVTLSMQGYNYNPSTITVKQNQPVKIVADLLTLQGCYRSLTIPAFNVQKIFSETDNVVQFVPTKKGTFPFSCYMGMGRGTLVVN